MIETRLATGDGSLQGGEDRLVVRPGTTDDIPEIKAIADREKHALGFVHRGSLMRSVARDELIVASVGTSVVGFCQCYRRRDGVAAVYHVAVVPERRGKGIGRALLDHVAWSGRGLIPGVVRLKCPHDLPANRFYPQVGFRLASVEAGRGRLLNVWERQVEERPCVPSVTPLRND